MIKYMKYYIVLFLSLSVLIGIFFGGHWMWLGLAVLFVVVIGGGCSPAGIQSSLAYRTPSAFSFAHDYNPAFKLCLGIRKYKRGFPGHWEIIVRIICLRFSGSERQQYVV